MDRIFTSADRQLLISLLRISGDTFGNVPAMARAYKLAAKRLHPDKGGNEADMKKLNELWNKFKDEIYRMREVKPCVNPVITCIVLGTCSIFALIRNTAQCMQNLLRCCTCICCLLFKQHRELKITYRRRCNVWGECYCFFCYYTWFGVNCSLNAFTEWLILLKHLDWRLLKISSAELDSLGKYNFYEIFLIHFVKC
ncbi:small t antigen [Sorex minutus polyomavirus 1]|uniref:Small T antigen n=1 Tax=Sorex minutus polyomavirus 1 TaxID=2560771 RepID=A0A223PYN7_9POLY|nr:small t antigen [Sorex minutus polyomavirus 1]ASU50442.1 small t antigen [Sorex minutus polyomavirus 1]ATJ00063.1 small T antigen [Sorex minutus polyomavirus 1]ATJ00068.1 small T antigen [Sorex minutus polyomavirus 1]